MATDWEKLSKLRRDYPKAKFAFSEVTRQRKKQPTNPYLLAWKADILLQLGSSGVDVVRENLQPILVHRPPITDTRLLVYVYKTIAEATRHHDPRTLGLASVGAPVQKAWENAAKTLKTRKARLDLWSCLFTCAMKEDCWEDVRWTLTQALKEGVKSKKTLDFTLILANQMVYQREKERTELLQEPEKKVQIQLMVAHSKIKQAFLNASKSGDDSIKVENMRDLRFMAQLFRLQDKRDELVQLWDNAPPMLREKLDQNYVEISLLILEYAIEQGVWDLAFAIAMAHVRDVIEHTDNPRNCKNDPLVKSWKLWGNLLEAEKNLDFDDVARAEMHKTILKAHQSVPFESRELLLASVAVALQTCPPLLLSRCQKYWLEYCHMTSCFEDLRRFIERMPVHDRQAFHSFISETAMSKKPESDNAEHKALRTWLQIEVNVLKFDYLLVISCTTRENSTDIVSAAGVEDFVNSAVQLYSIGARIKDDCYHDAGILAIMGLFVLHSQFVDDSWDYCNMAARRLGNSRLLLQAGFLALHATAGEAGKQNRPLLLLSTRVHLQLGLATISFSQYSQVRVKEILHDTLSHHFLTRISQTHPFDAKGPKGFSPDAELSKVITTIQRMESRVDDFLYIDMQDFLFDQAMELLDFKRRLKSSLSKHLCLIERRRIARFKGETVDSAFDLPLEDYYMICDNREFHAIPDFESSIHKRSVPSYITGTQPLAWLYERSEQEDISRILFKELRDTHIQERLRRNRMLWGTQGGIKDYLHPVEQGLAVDWVVLRGIVDHVLADDPSRVGIDFKDDFEELIQIMIDWTCNMEVLIIPDQPFSDPADETMMPHENGLMYIYGHLELMQLIWKLCEATKETLKKGNNKLRSKATLEVVEECAKEVQKFHQLIRRVATSHINALKQRGVKSVLAQVRWGSTGATLRKLMTDGEQRRYAQDYVESAIEALEGILMVKIK